MSTDMKHTVQPPSPVAVSWLDSAKNFLCAIKNKTVEGFKGIRDKMDRFNQIMVEGHYRSDEAKVISAIFGWQPKKLPVTGSAIAGKAMLGTGQTVAKRIIWGGVFAFFAISKLAIVGAASVLVGAGFLAKEFKAARQARKDIIEEVNFCGQFVRGRRADLCRLHYAQVEIGNLFDSFKPGSMESTSDTIVRILRTVEKERQRVTVLDPGRNRADSKVYDFAEPLIKLVNENPGNLVQHRGEGAAPADIRYMEIARAFNEGAIQFSPEMMARLADEVAKRLAERQAEAQTPDLVTSAPIMPPVTQNGSKTAPGAALH